MPNTSNYFDYAAATPMLPEVVAAMQPFFSDSFYNPSALYLGARHNRQVLEDARHSIASSIGARPTELIFTAGGTEANNIAIQGIMNTQPNGHVIYSAIEHESVIQAAQKYANSQVAVDAHGIVSTDSIATLITDTTVLISVMYANNEIGTLQPISQIAELIKTVKKDRQTRNVNTPIYLHVDACQAANYCDLQVARLGVDLLSINAGKIYGPKQCGALFVKVGTELSPLIVGGGQEWNMRSGTENLANIVGFATAWQRVRGDYRNEAKRLSSLRDDFLQHIIKDRPNIAINGALGSKRLANNINLTINGYDNERILMMLDEQGIQIATGSACNASNDEPSHVLAAIGLTDDAARQSIRITLGRYSTEESVKNLYAQLTKIVAIQ